jgi:hypothetical protein
MNNNFEMGQTINGDFKILSEKDVNLHMQPKKDLNLNDPIFIENQWMLKKHQELCDRKKAYENHSFEKCFYYEFQDQDNNVFELKSKKYLGKVGDVIPIKNCRIKAKKSLSDGKVVFILANGSQKQYESFRKWQK